MYEGNNNYNNAYNNYGNGGYQPPQPPKRGPNVILRSLVIFIVLVAVITSSIGIYKWASGDSNTLDPAPLETTSGDSNASNNSNASLNLTNYDLDFSPSAVAAKVIPSVVCIQNYQQGYGQDGFMGMQQEDNQLAAEGSGIVYTEDGYIITNAHVVSGASLIKVVLSNGNVYEAKLVGIDEETDLALLKIEATGLTAAEFGSANDLAAGDFVMAVGNPGGLEFESSVTLGIVSALNRPLEIENGYTMNTVQTDAAINPGNSGGALVDMKGKVVGIPSAKYVATGYEGLGFAITIDEALPIIEDLKEHGEVKNRGRLGVTGMILDSVTAARNNLVEGFYVQELVNTDAGTLQNGDVITKIDDTEISSQSDIKKAIQNKQPGTSVTITYWRNGETETTTLKLMEYMDS